MSSSKVVPWRPDDGSKPTPEEPGSDTFRPEILDLIEHKIDELSDDLRRLSLDIHAHPELGFEEVYTHDVLSSFMSKQGFEVKTHYLLDTAWLATFKHGKGGRTIGVNSEMDALRGIGHACGHNLIAIAGVAVACAMKAVLERFDISGTIQLLGTPAEEGGGGKCDLLDRGAYKDMAICLMHVFKYHLLFVVLKTYQRCHPAPGPTGSVSLSSCLAAQQCEVEYFGHTAHAALSPWEGINALDAAVLAYTNIGALRQQLKPNVRVHGIFEGRDWATNIIPDYAKYSFWVRSTNRVDQETAFKRVLPCLEASAKATGCNHKITMKKQFLDIRQNKALGDEVARIVRSRYGAIDYEWGIKDASTDFGNVTYEIPSLHPGFAIPTIENGGNHTSAFERAAATIEAHNACLDVSKALATTGIRALIDDEFFSEVQRAFEEDKKVR
ncbi:hypothetical protein K435DRAFT_709295 [Dendrothele bispora CBS 962.96]|uniref:Peptidase M20 domain-containing protein 2 n=1 Tax=Dendrothele bispora (strain CBS 962.96) TaxID=1314807 RepID=A0A4S8MXA6_DENBC|nr:hypothetical protein K435DRAFT_709295 [Dendrothele bispora CBS 962.96]